MEAINLPQIQIQQTYTKIGIDRTPARMEIEQPKANINMKQEHIQAKIEYDLPKIQIDQTKAWGALGKVPPLELSKRITDNIRNVVMDTIANIAEKGDRLAAIHIKQDPIPDYADGKFIRLPELNFEDSPSSDNVDISVQPGSVDIQFKGGTFEMNVEQKKPIVNYTRGNIEIYIQQKNSIEITSPKVDISI